jgi:hypothetical protein
MENDDPNAVGQGGQDGDETGAATFDDLMEAAMAHYADAPGAGPEAWAESVDAILGEVKTPGGLPTAELVRLRKRMIEEQPDA